MIDGEKGDGRTSPPRWQSVKSDMQAIFGAEGAARRRTRTPTSVARPTRSRSRTRRIAIPLAVLTCAAGAAAGLVVVAPLRQPQATRPAAAMTHADTRTPTTARPTAMAVMTAPSSPAPPVLPAWHGTAAPDTAQSIETARIAPEQVQTPADPAAGEQQGRTGCDDEDEAGYAACSRADVILADRDLRQAYLRAVDVGVDRGQLVSIRSRWARLRATEYDRPDTLLAGYAELTDRLDRAVEYAGGDLR